MKPFITILLIIVFSISLLFGCAQTNDAQSAGTNESATATTAGEEALSSSSSADQSADPDASGTQELVLTLEELAAYNGQDGMPAYIAVDGIIYDVSDVIEWTGGAHNGFSAGNDLTEQIKTISPHGVSKLTGVPAVGTLAD